jgi:hypothetical protein
MAEQLLLYDCDTTWAPSAPVQRAPSEIPPAQRRPWSGNTFVHLTVLVAAAIIVVVFATQWDRPPCLRGFLCRSCAPDTGTHEGWRCRCSFARCAV